MQYYLHMMVSVLVFLSSLKGVGYGTASKTLPVITGQDAELASVKSIIAGEQTQTVFKDTRELAKKAVAMADAFLKEKSRSK